MASARARISSARQAGRAPCARAREGISARMESQRGREPSGRAERATTNRSTKPRDKVAPWSAFPMNLQCEWRFRNFCCTSSGRIPASPFRIPAHEDGERDEETYIVKQSGQPGLTRELSGSKGVALEGLFGPSLGRARGRGEEEVEEDDDGDNDHDDEEGGNTKRNTMRARTRTMRMRRTAWTRTHGAIL